MTEAKTDDGLEMPSIFKEGDRVISETNGVGTGVVDEVYWTTSRPGWPGVPGYWKVSIRRDGTPVNPAHSWSHHANAEHTFRRCEEPQRANHGCACTWIEKPSTPDCPVMKTLDPCSLHDEWARKHSSALLELAREIVNASRTPFPFLPSAIPHLLEQAILRDGSRKMLATTSEKYTPYQEALAKVALSLGMPGASFAPSPLQIRCWFDDQMRKASGRSDKEDSVEEGGETGGETFESSGQVKVEGGIVLRRDKEHTCAVPDAKAFDPGDVFVCAHCQAHHLLVDSTLYQGGPFWERRR